MKKLPSSCCPERELGFSGQAQAQEAQMHDDPQEGLLQPSNNAPGVIPANGPLVFQEQKIGGGRNYKEA